jgi:hypothetical protein
VLGSIVNQELKDKIPQHVPQSAIAQMPEQLRGQITDPQVLFSDKVQAAIAGIPNPQVQAAFAVIKSGVKLALADSVHLAFEIGLVSIILGLLLTLFIKEIPLRKTSALQDRAAARAAAESGGL